MSSGRPRSGWEPMLVAAVGLALVAVSAGGTTHEAWVPGTGPTLELDDVVADSFKSIEAFWTSGRAIALLNGHRVRFEAPVPYDPRAEDALPPCNGRVVDAPLYIDNAFFCGTERRVIYDEVGLMPSLRAEFGDLAVSVVIAHEYGHAVQAEVGLEVRGLDGELQADCFAGAWAGTDQRDERELALVFRSLFAASDPRSDPPILRTHGTGFERIRAFATGLARGIAPCLALGHGGWPVIPNDGDGSRNVREWLWPILRQQLNDDLDQAPFAVAAGDAAEPQQLPMGNDAFG